MSVINRVWDAHLTGTVPWETPRVDDSGELYPGPGTFSAQTSDFCVEGKLDSQAAVTASVLNLTAPTGSVEALWLFADLTDESANNIGLTHGGTEYNCAGFSPNTQCAFINGEVITSPQSATSDPIRFTGAMTLEMLIRPADFVTDANAVLCHFQNSGSGTANNTLYGLRLLANNVLEYMHEDSGEVQRSGSTGLVIPPGRWTHLAVTRDAQGTLIRVYVDGSMIHRETLGGAPDGGSNSHIQIGDAEGTDDRRYYGFCGSVRITDAEFLPEHVLESARAALPPGSRP